MPFAPLHPPLRVQPAVSATLGINERVRQLWDAGETVYHLGFGEARFPVHPRIAAALRDNADQGGYVPVQGLPALREAIAAYDGRLLNQPFTADQVVIGPGSKPLLYSFIGALDGTLLLPTPSWVSYAPQAHLWRGRVQYIPASGADDYRLTIAGLDTAVRAAGDTPKTLLINSPNNPTGQMLTADFLAELADYCRQHRIVVLSDEIYGRLTHGSISHRSLVEFYPEGTVVLGGLSKHLSLGGWRLGKAIVPDQLADLKTAVVSLGSEIWSCASTPVQHAAVTAYSGDPDIEATVDAAAALHGVRTHHLWSWLVELGIRCPRPAGSFYLLPNFDRWRQPLARRGITTSDTLARHLLDKYHVATLPGSLFGIPESELSLRLATSYIDLEHEGQAAALLAAWQAGTPADTIVDQHPHLQAAIGQFEQFIHDLSADASSTPHAD